MNICAPACGGKGPGASGQLPGMGVLEPGATGAARFPGTGLCHSQNPTVGLGVPRGSASPAALGVVGLADLDLQSGVVIISSD